MKYYEDFFLVVINMFTHFAHKYFRSQMTIANLFNCSHFFLIFFYSSFFYLSDFNIFFLLQCEIGNFDFPNNVTYFSLNEKIPPHLRKQSYNISGSQKNTPEEHHYMHDLFLYSYILPMASAKGHCHTQLNLTRWMLNSYFVFSGKGLWSTFFYYKVG